MVKNKTLVVKDEARDFISNTLQVTFILMFLMILLALVMPNFYFKGWISGFLLVASSACTFILSIFHIMIYKTGRLATTGLILSLATIMIFIFQLRIMIN